MDGNRGDSIFEKDSCWDDDDFDTVNIHMDVPTAESSYNELLGNYDKDFDSERRFVPSS